MTKRQNRILVEHEKDPTASIAVKALRAGCSKSYTRTTIKKHGSKTGRPAILSTTSHAPRIAHESAHSLPKRLRRRAALAALSTNPEELAILASKEPSKNIKVLIAIAGNDYAAQETLDILADHENHDVRYTVACNDAAHGDTLTKLFHTYKSYCILSALACNPSTPEEILKTLADPFAYGWSFLEQVAGNPNAPEETLKELARNKFGYIRFTVAGNPNAPRATLFELMRHDPFEVVNLAALQTLSKSGRGNYDFTGADHYLYQRLLEDLERI